MWKRHLIFKFEECHATEQIIVGLTMLIQKGREWRHMAPISIISADVKAGFDFLSVDVVMQSCFFWDLPGYLVNALVEETLDLTASAMLYGIGSAGRFSFNWSVKQGGKSFHGNGTS